MTLAASAGWFIGRSGGSGVRQANHTDNSAQPLVKQQFWSVIQEEDQNERNIIHHLHPLFGWLDDVI